MSSPISGNIVAQAEKSSDDAARADLRSAQAAAAGDYSEASRQSDVAARARVDAAYKSQQAAEANRR